MLQLGSIGICLSKSFGFALNKEEEGGDEQQRSGLGSFNSRVMAGSSMSYSSIKAALRCTSGCAERS